MTRHERRMKIERMKNLWAAYIMETVALAPKKPFILVSKKKRKKKK